MGVESTGIIYDDEAEQAVLGAMMEDKDTIPNVVSTLGQTPEAFYNKAHQLIYSAISYVYEENNTGDVMLVAKEIKRKQYVNRIGGLPYLYDLLDRVVDTVNAEYYADIVKENFMRRRLIQTGDFFKRIAYAQESPVDEILDKAEQTIFELSHAGGGRGFVPIREALITAMDKIEERHSGDDNGYYTGIPTGFVDIDSATSGLQPGELIIIAARPGVGKSTLALNIARNVAVNSKLPVAIFSLEMTSELLALRLLSAESGLSFADIQSARLEQDEWKILGKAMGTLADSAPIFINDSRGITMLDVRSEARRLKAEHDDLSLVIVDYMQLMQGNARYPVREQEIADISRSLKTLAWELDVPVMALSQLSREIERRPSHRPLLSDLRESGAIEQDADLVAFIHREDLYDEDTEKQNEAEFVIKKQRNGPSGISIPLDFDMSMLRFMDAAGG